MVSLYSKETERKEKSKVKWKSKSAKIKHQGDGVLVSQWVRKRDWVQEYVCNLRFY